MSCAVECDVLGDASSLRPFLQAAAYSRLGWHSEVMLGVALALWQILLSFCHKRYDYLTLGA